MPIDLKNENFKDGPSYILNYYHVYFFRNIYDDGMLIIQKVEGLILELVYLLF